jgi:hypothetical protein
MILCCGKHCLVGKGTHLDLERRDTLHNITVNTIRPPASLVAGAT